jgi:hypothetical protein
MGSIQRNVAFVKYPGGTLALSEDGHWSCPENRTAEDTANRVASMGEIRESDGEPRVAQAKLLCRILQGEMFTCMPRRRASQSEVKDDNQSL